MSIGIDPMEKMYPTSPRGQLDAGEGRDKRCERRELCTKGAWCALKAGHRGSCRKKQRVSEERPITKLVLIERKQGG